eukprot:scaffold62430_cov34-Prasinocladus_malaysianus.AAC.1
MNLTAVASPNCSDVLELKIRYECEIALPEVIRKHASWTNERFEETNLSDLFNQYVQATESVRAVMAEVEAVNATMPACYMGAPPRSTRYEIAQKVSQLLNDDHGGALLSAAEIPGLSVLNMSYSYAEPAMGHPGSCSLRELSDTCRMALAVIYHHRLAQVKASKKQRASTT